MPLITNQSSAAIPFDRSYWVIPGKLIAGSYPSSDDPYDAQEKLERLLSIGIDCTINLTEPTEMNSRGVLLKDYEADMTRLSTLRNTKKCRCYRIPIKDLGIPSPERMNAILDTIDREIDEGHRVYVHCWGGIGRTGTVVGCYLVRHGLSGGEALRMIAYLRRTEAKAHVESPETWEQREFVNSWTNSI